MLSNLLTHSRLAAARRCARLHHYKYNLGFRPVRLDEALRFGDLMARAKEVYRVAFDRTGNPFNNVLLFLDSLTSDECDDFDRERIAALMAGYHARWYEEDSAANTRFRATEAQFRVRLRNPESGHPSRTFDIGGKVDALAERDEVGGRKFFCIEDKTSSEDITAGSEYWRRLRIDGQVSQYWRAGKVLFDRQIDGVLYDVIGKPGIRPLLATPEDKRKYRKDDGALYAGQRATDETPAEFGNRLRESIAENPDAYFQRAVVVRLGDEIREYDHEVWLLGDTIREQANRGVHPRNPDACRDYGRLCPFFDVCTGAARLDDPYLFHQSNNVHPELETDRVPHVAQ